MLVRDNVFGSVEDDMIRRDYNECTLLQPLK